MPNAWTLIRWAMGLYLMASLLGDHAQALEAAEPEDPLFKIHVSISQLTIRSPIKVCVTNRNKKPITFLKMGSPLDKGLLERGGFHVWPEFAEPVKFNEKPPAEPPLPWPIKPSHLITIKPGESKEQKVKFTNPRCKIKGKKRAWFGHLGKRADVHLHGKWRAVWLKSDAEVLVSLMGDWKKGLLSGDYKSNGIRTFLY